MTEHNPYETPQSNVVPTPSQKTKGQKLTIEEAIATNYDFTISEVITEAWANVTHIKLPIFLGLIIMFIITIIINISLSNLPETAQDIASFISNVFISVLETGLIVIVFKRLNNQPIKFIEDFFSIMPIILTLILANFLLTLFTLIGMILFIIPGIYLVIAYTLTNYIIIDNPHIGAWQALEASRKIVTKHWFKFLGLILGLGMLCVISAIPLGIGLIWTIPLCLLSIAVIYKKIFYA